MKILVREVVTNGNRKTLYVYGGETYRDLPSLLKKNFATQGDFYREVMGVSEEDAHNAGWHPMDEDFDSRDCEGWKIFIKCRGVIDKRVTEKDVNIREVLFPTEE